MSAYKGKFEYDPWTGWITSDKNPFCVADDIKHSFDKEEHWLRIRGWGGLHTVLGEHVGAKVQDAFGRRVAELLNTYGVGDEVKSLIIKPKETKK